MRIPTYTSQVYGSLFTEPNPPARVTVSCGEAMPCKTNIVIHLRIPKMARLPQEKKALHVQSRSYWAPANIGPYSQATSIIASESNGQEKSIWTVAVAGQIPLIPHTMALPPLATMPNLSTYSAAVLENFSLQNILALQHLWRIGEEMDVGWWSSAVAYLSRDATEAISTKARIACRAWTHLHKVPIVADADADEERDLWEEKHHAGMEHMGVSQIEKALPDWTIVEPKGATQVPPVFAAEVEELPRQSAIEWHAHSGVVNGPVKVSCRSISSQSTSDKNQLDFKRGDSWSIHRCAFGSTVHSIFTRHYSEEFLDLRTCLEEAFQAIGIRFMKEHPSHASYIDTSVINNLEDGVYGGIMPCRSIWDVEGKRLAVALLYDIASAADG